MYFFVLALIKGQARRAVITMRSSNLTSGRTLNDLLDNLEAEDEQGKFKPAAYSGVFNLKTTGKNWGDKSWHIYKPSFVRMLDISKPEDLSIYDTAKNFKKKLLQVQRNLSMNRLHQLRVTKTSSSFPSGDAGQAKALKGDWRRLKNRDRYERFYKVFYRVNT